MRGRGSQARYGRITCCWPSVPRNVMLVVFGLSEVPLYLAIRWIAGSVASSAKTSPAVLASPELHAHGPVLIEKPEHHSPVGSTLSRDRT